VGEIVLVRHGQTEWSATHRHTSYTDLPLTDLGADQAREVGAALAARRFAAVLCSPRRRARDTAALAGLAVTAIDDDLAEWDYGGYEGRTTAEIVAQRPGWDLWRDGCPGGESPEQVGARLDRALARAAAALDSGQAAPEGADEARPGADVALVGHGHSLRVAGARWVGLAPAAGGLLVLETGTLSVLGHEHQRRTIRCWNAPVGG
jgi:broad specificity phosphatase PhoE